MTLDELKTLLIQRPGGSEVVVFNPADWLGFQLHPESRITLRGLQQGGLCFVSAGFNPPTPGEVVFCRWDTLANHIQEDQAARLQELHRQEQRSSWPINNGSTC